MIRPARPSDIEKLVELVGTKAAAHYPELRPKPDELRATVIGCVSSPSAFVRVSVSTGGVSGGLIAVTEKGAWFERAVCKVVFLFSAIPGDGYRMLREFKEWVQQRPAIKAVQIVADFEEADRVGKVLSRAGFPKRGVVHGFMR